MALAQILLRGGTSAEWAAANPVLAAREIAYDTTLKRAKVGDGQNSWSALPWVTMSAAEVARLEAAAAALEGATAPTDAAMTSIQANPASAFAKAQKATFVAFQKEDGTPLVAKRVIITVSNDGTSISDIKVVS